MAKVCILSMDGDFDKGFNVSLRIKGETDLRSQDDVDDDGTVAGTTGRLRSAPHLIQQYKNWKKRYSSLETRFRMENFSFRMERSSSSAPTLGTSRGECQQAFKELVQNFRHWLKDTDFRDIEDELRTHLQPDEEIQLLIQTDNDQLQKLPWDSWEFCRQYTKMVVGLSPRRYKRPRSFAIPEKFKILAILGCSKNIDTQEDKKLLESLSPHAEIKFIAEPKRKEFEKLWEERWDILFFAGHSYSQKNEKTGYLYINKNERIEISELDETLRQAIGKGLKLAIFNSCDGLEIAQQLLSMHIPQVIVWREPVPDEVAQKFLKDFLTEFSQGNSLPLAVRKAKAKLREASEVETRFPGVSWLPIIDQNPSAESLKWPKIAAPPSEPATPQPPPQKPNGKEWLARIGLNKQKLLLASAIFGAAILAVLASQFFHSKSLEYRSRQESEKVATELNQLVQSVPLSKERRIKLNQTQDNWKIWQNAECELQASLGESSSTQPNLKYLCLKKITEQRIKDFDYYPPFGSPPKKEGDPQKEDTKLKQTYEELKKKLPNREREIKTTDRSWKNFRFASCEFERSGGGKRAQNDCLIRMTEERIKTLKNDYLKPPKKTSP